jgi:hypothetical protein
MNNNLQLTCWGELGLGPKRKTCDSFCEQRETKTEQVYSARRAGE